ncbi:carboxylesterase [Saccharata proteae CBS 121410]|uniref:Carboxylic ester hydrolase n=1 Tax=Saccharata proteae CBS 121410 TaxID=1314787 RepID=A0A9P4HZ96_9PEZI|nr:carboxylesterase [Saccharata proteae CBS 121410]
MSDCDQIQEPYLKDLEYRGFIQGLTIKAKATGKPLCHYFGGIPYALPPKGDFRWRMPRPLAPCYRYGTRSEPGLFNKRVSICPQPAPGRDEGPEVDEDCLQCNIWVPTTPAPKGGFPVLFYIHGGFLQLGSANDIVPTSLLSETDCKCVIVMPGYRLNVFGFMASYELQTEAQSNREPVGNYGFWDQRLALEWTHKNVSYFGGNPGNITVAGYSAGAHSVFKQLAYDLYLPREKALIRRAVMWSNGPGLQPTSLEETQDQFEELVAQVGIPAALPAAWKLRELRKLPAKTLVAALNSIRKHQFRAVTDGVFVRGDVWADLEGGGFAARMLDRGVELMMGECRDEHFVYGSFRPPHNDLGSLAVRLNADYPAAAVEALVPHYFPGDELPAKYKDWLDAYGRVYADVQIYALERGLVDVLWRTGAGHLVKRYRVEWRARCMDAVVPKEWGVTHTTDLAIWFWGADIGKGLDSEEQRIVQQAFVSPFAQFLKGEDMAWENEGPKQVRRLDSDGNVGSWEDATWEEDLAICDVLQVRAGVRSRVGDKNAAKL